MVTFVSFANQYGRSQTSKIQAQMKLDEAKDITPTGSMDNVADGKGKSLSRKNSKGEKSGPSSSRNKSRPTSKAADQSAVSLYDPSQYSADPEATKAWTSLGLTKKQETDTAAQKNALDKYLDDE